MANIVFTTSWDDGSVLDLKVADLLSRYGMKGTFYIPENFDGKSDKHSEYAHRLTNEEIRALSLTQEVGGHSLSHRSLTDMSLDEARKEIVGSVEFLKNSTGHVPTMFAYPRGRYNDALAHIVAEVGFKGARTTRKLSITLNEGRSQVDTTVMCQPFPFRKLNATQYYWRRILDPLHAYTPKQFSISWQSLAKKWFRRALTDGNYFHLYGHSWEIEKYGMWAELESFLMFVKGHENVVCLSNGEVVEQKTI